MLHSQSLKILVVDDHAPSIAVLCHALTSRGHACEAVSTATDALNCVDRFQPQVVFYEWNLRGGQVCGLAARLRAASRSVAFVIVLSTLNEPDEFCENELVDAYLTKPFDVGQVESVLYRLSRRSAAL